MLHDARRASASGSTPWGSSSRAAPGSRARADQGRGALALRRGPARGQGRPQPAGRTTWVVWRSSPPSCPPYWRTASASPPWTGSPPGTAVLEPAGLPQGEDLASPPLRFAEAALAELLDFLEGRSGGVEPFQLQVLCRHLERQAVGRDPWGYRVGHRASRPWRSQGHGRGAGQLLPRRPGCLAGLAPAPPRPQPVRVGPAKRGGAPPARGAGRDPARLQARPGHPGTSGRCPPAARRATPGRRLLRAKPRHPGHGRARPAAAGGCRGG